MSWNARGGVAVAVHCWYLRTDEVGRGDRGVAVAISLCKVSLGGRDVD